MMVHHTEERRKGPYWDIAQVLLISVKLKTLTFAGSKLNTKTYHSALIHMQFSVPFFIYVYPFFWFMVRFSLPMQCYDKHMNTDKCGAVRVVDFFGLHLPLLLYL